MYISVFDMYKIGLGPSSSHTVGPIKACSDFIGKVKKSDNLNKLYTINLDLYGSFALTMEGHNTHVALQIGLMGYKASEVNPDDIPEIINKIKNEKKLNFNQEKLINFEEEKNIFCHKNEILPYHSNGFIISAFDESNNKLTSEEYYSIGGGFIKTKKQMETNIEKEKLNVPFDFSSWCELKKHCIEQNKEIYDIIYKNELTLNSEKEIDSKLKKIYNTMLAGIEKSLNRTEEMPGKTGIKRRANNLLKKINENDPLSVFDNIFMWGIATSEENATFGRIVTAPTNGSAGIIPAVIKFLEKYYNLSFDMFKKFMFASSAIGMLCKLNASIAGASGGCQAECGSATAMAAAGIVAAIGGTTDQIENAAIISLTHNLGLTCDSVGGLVQVPCIERNGAKAVEAVSAARIALLEKASGYLLLDQVIRTMKEVGDDMKTIYKETSLGGLAIFAKTGRCNGECNTCKFY